MVLMAKEVSSVWDKMNQLFFSILSGEPEFGEMAISN